MEDLHPVSEVQHVMETVNFIKADEFNNLARPWPRGQDIDDAYFKKAMKDDLVLAVSHAWPYGAHPDPLDNKGLSITQMVNDAKAAFGPQGKTLLFCDFMSVSQRPFKPGQTDRTAEEQEDFAKALSAFPQIYLQADAVLHIDTPTEQIRGDATPYTATLHDLDSVTLVAINNNVHVVKVDEAIPTSVSPFDAIVSINGREIHTLADVQQARLAYANEVASFENSAFPWFWQCRCSTAPACVVQMKRLPFGIYSGLSADQKGWVYLERFASMVKGAMAHRDQEANVAFTTSDALLAELRAGSQRLRLGAEGGKEKLKEALQYFVRELEKKQFTAVSVDKAKNEGGLGGGGGPKSPTNGGDVENDDDNDPADKESGFRRILSMDDRPPPSDREVVANLMAELVADLEQHWQARQQAQRQRQLVMAVARGDVAAVKQLIDVGVDPNLPDAQGMTCLHIAAKARELEVVKLLVRCGGNLRMADGQGNLPAHRLALYAREPTVELFEILAPTRDIQLASNKALVTPIQRFAAWGTTAVDSKPYPPAQEFMAKILKESPNIPLRSTANIKAYNSLVKKQAVERQVEVMVKGSRRPICTFEPKSGGVSHHMVWIAMELYMPWGMQKPGVAAMADFLCEKYSLKIWVISEQSYVPESFDLADVESREDEVLQIVEALPFQDKFLYVMNSCHGGVKTIWSLGARRISAAVIMNFTVWFSDEFYGSPAFQGMMKVLGGHMATYGRRDIDGAEKYVGNFLFTPCPQDLERVVALYRSELKVAGDNFWKLTEHLKCMEQTPYLETLPPLPAEVPLIMACGSLSPALIVQESAMRLCEIARNSSLAYIPDSKQWWSVEGDAEVKAVAYLLGEVLSFNGKHFDAKALVEHSDKRRSQMG